MATDNFARILALKAKGASETVTYSSLPDKPTINNVTINGDLSLEDLGITEIWVGTYNEYLEVASTLADGTLVIITDDDTIDSVPTQNSTNLVTSGGVYAFVVNNTLPASTKYAANVSFSMNGNSFVCDFGQNELPESFGIVFFLSRNGNCPNVANSCFIRSSRLKSPTTVISMYCFSKTGFKTEEASAKFRFSKISRGGKK